MNKVFAALLTGFLAITMFAAAPTAVMAVDFIPDDVCNQADNESSACSENEETLGGRDGILNRAAVLLSVIAAISAVVVIMVAGIIIVMAGGDSNKISTARNMITYALVGLVIIFLARAIVAFFINVV